MDDFEKLGVFYLGRKFDRGAGRPTGEPLLYDARDLVTHAVCVGMTGSGKTGLCLALLEEAAIDGVPALAIDPKGDLGNLLLTFPQLRGEDFAPWIDPDEARRAALSPDAFAAREAQRWQQGLAQWGQSGDRIARLRQGAELAIYTPGSTAGLPLSMLRSWAAPPPEIAADAELLAERVQTTVGSLLSLMGIDADPLQSREHILLASICEAAWRQRRDLDLPGLVAAIRQPPLERVGVVDVETFYPASQRFELAMRLNRLLAAPGFELWSAGQPLDVGQLLYTPAGKPRIAIVSIAHLDEAQRMFVVALVLSRVVDWVRSQPGTSSLRALVYLDEIAGYCPPVANPPSKRPLLVLLKQARAAGLGVVLATQNPADLDYKGLANAGTWFIGRLQTQRDRDRLLGGIEGAWAAGSGWDRAALDEAVASLDKRVFLLHGIHEPRPELFQARWALCYLRGPLTRDEIKTLIDPLRGAPAAEAPQAAAAAPSAAGAAVVEAHGLPAARPVIDPAIGQCFLPLRAAPPEHARLVYSPLILGTGHVHFRQARSDVDFERPLVAVVAAADEAAQVDWSALEALEVSAAELESEPLHEAAFLPVPRAALRPASYGAWKRALTAAWQRGQRLELVQWPVLGLISRPAETPREFRIRLAQAAREARDREADALRDKYAAKLAALEARIARARQAVERETGQASSQRIETAVSLGATILAALLGRRTRSSSTLSRAGGAARQVSRSQKQAHDVVLARERLAGLEAQRQALDDAFRRRLAEITARLDPQAAELEPLVVKPSKGQVAVEDVRLAWAPYWQTPDGGRAPAWRSAPSPPPPGR